MTPGLHSYYRSLNALAHEKTLDCQAGCAACCHFTVPAFMPEILTILDMLRDSQSLLADLFSAPSAGTRDSKGQPKPCPFLNEDRTCNIYAYRPFACRAYVSTDLSLCEERIRTGEDSPSRVPDGLAASYADSRTGYRKQLRSGGLDAREYRLDDTLRALLPIKDARHRWEQGEQVPDLSLKL